MTASIIAAAALSILPCGQDGREGQGAKDSARSAPVYRFVGTATRDTGASTDLAAEYAIQVGAFSRESNAVALRDTLRARGFYAEIFENFIDGKSLLYLLWVGKYESPEAAEADLERLKRQTGIDGVLRERVLWRKKN